MLQRRPPSPGVQGTAQLREEMAKALRDQGYVLSEDARGMRLSKAVPPLACGVPVVYAGDDEMAALIEREGCGVRVPPGRPDLLADAIARLVDDPERRRAMGRRGRALAERAFAWPALVDAWLAQVAALRGAGGAVGARAGAG